MRTFSRLRTVVTARVPAAALVVAVVAGGAGSATAAKLITGKDVKNSSLTGSDLKDRSITGRDVKDRSLTRSDFARGVLPATSQVVGRAGVPGSPGAAGNQGAQGTAGTDAFGTLVYVKAGPFDNGAGEVTQGAAVCPEGRFAIGGGAWGDAEPAGQALTVSAPATADNKVQPNRWQVWMSNASKTNASFDVYAVCASSSKVVTP